MTAPTDREILQLYPELADVDAGGIAPVKVEAGTVLFGEASHCAGFPLRLLGAVRVFRSSGEGRQLELSSAHSGRTLPRFICGQTLFLD